jgi:hypothetical protein
LLHGNPSVKGENMNGHWNGAIPAARIADLVITESKDEVLVYDTSNHHIHHLNRLSAVVWRLCDGSRSVADVTRMTRASVSGEVNDEVVRMALTKLEAADLLSGALETQMRALGQSRRSFLRKAAVAGAVVVPAIVSMTAPQAAAALSPGPGRSCGGACSQNSNCNGCCSQCNGDGTTVPQFPRGICFNPNKGGAQPQLSCNSN